MKEKKYFSHETAIIDQDYSLVVGNPSQHIWWVSEYGHRLKFNDKGIAICHESNQEYTLEKNTVKRTK